MGLHRRLCESRVCRFRLREGFCVKYPFKVYTALV